MVGMYSGPNSNGLANAMALWNSFQKMQNGSSGSAGGMASPGTSFAPPNPVYDDNAHGEVDFGKNGGNTSNLKNAAGTAASLYGSAAGGAAGGGGLLSSLGISSF